MIRVVDLDLGTIDTFAGDHVEAQSLPESLPGYAGDGGDATLAVFHHPTDVAVGPDGRVYLVDSGNHCVRVVDLDGIVDTFAGRCAEDPDYAGDGGPARDATFNSPFGVAVDAAGYVYVADTGNMVVRRVAP